jgi:hypothetical protein
VTAEHKVIGLIACAAGGLETLLDGFVEPARARGYRIAITLTPAAGQWLAHTAERARLERATGFPVRVGPRMPGEQSPHPPADCYLVAPASANSVAKIALGISDNQALTTVVEAIGHGQVPVIVFPRINAAHARHPAWAAHIAALQRVGVHVVQGEDVWALHEPREAPPDRRLPWIEILDMLDGLTDGT